MYITDGENRGRQCIVTVTDLSRDLLTKRKGIIWSLFAK